MKCFVLLKANVSIFFICIWKLSLLAQPLDYRAFQLNVYEDKVKGSFLAEQWALQLADSFEKNYRWLPNDSLWLNLSPVIKNITNEPTQESAWLLWQTPELLQRKPLKKLPLPNQTWRTTFQFGVPLPLVSELQHPLDEELNQWAVLAPSLAAFTPGMLNQTTENAFKIGIAFADGEGLQAGIFTAAVASELYFEKDILNAMHRAFLYLPKGCMLEKNLLEDETYASFVQFDAACLKTYLKDKYLQNNGCSRSDAVHNEYAFYTLACIHLGSILGNGELISSLKWSMLFSDDPQAIASILGKWHGIRLGLKSIQSLLRVENRIESSFVPVMQYVVKEFKEIAFLAGGTIRNRAPNERCILPNEDPKKLPKLTKRNSNFQNVLEEDIFQSYALTCTYKTNVSVQNFWYFGDYASDTMPITKHVYDDEGIYHCWNIQSDSSGNYNVSVSSLQVGRNIPTEKITFQKPVFKIKWPESFIEPQSILKIQTELQSSPAMVGSIQLWIDSVLLIPVLPSTFEYKLPDHLDDGHLIQIYTFDKHGNRALTEGKPFYVGHYVRMNQKSNHSKTHQLTLHLTADSIVELKFNTEWWFDTTNLYYEITAYKNAYMVDSVLNDTTTLKVQKYSRYDFSFGSILEVPSAQCKNNTENVHLRFDSKPQFFKINHELYPSELHVLRQNLVDRDVYTLQIPKSKVAALLRSHQIVLESTTFGSDTHQHEREESESYYQIIPKN